jgi:hypothetical protein
VVDSFKYLGLMVFSNRGFNRAVDEVHSIAVKAMWGCMRQIRDKEVMGIRMRVELFKALIMPVMMYGCELWGGVSVSPRDPYKNPVQGVQSLFLRQVAGVWVKRSTALRVLSAEYGCRPMAFHCFKAICRYWNKLVTQPATSYLGAAFRENLSMASNHGAQGVWSAEVLGALAEVDEQYVVEVMIQASGEVYDDIEQLDVEGCAEKWVDISDAYWKGEEEDPRTAGSNEVTACTYREWMSINVDKAAPYVQRNDVIRGDHLSDLTQFRLGTHWLAVAEGRYRNPVTKVPGRVDRTLRVCRLCSEGVVEDEEHLLIGCQAYRVVRDRFQDVFGEGGGEMHPPSV